MHASGPASLSAKFFWNSVSERTLQTRFAAPQSQRWKCKRKGRHLNECKEVSIDSTEDCQLFGRLGTAGSFEGIETGVEKTLSGGLRIQIGSENAK